MRSRIGGLFSEREILPCVLVANAAHDTFKTCPVIGIFTVFDPLADEVTENPAEIFVAGIRNKGTTVGQHSHKPAEDAEIAEGAHLPFHAVTLIVEPPAGTELNLAGGRRALETPHDRRQHIIVLRVQGIEDCLRQAIRKSQNIQESGQIGRDLAVIDRIKPRVRPEETKHLRIVMVQGAASSAWSDRRHPCAWKKSMRPVSQESSSA